MTRAPAAEDPAKEDRSPVLFARRWLKRQTDKTLISDMVRGLLDQIDIEGAAWKRLSMVELAAENESAMEHVVHWEGRALRAEAEAARLREEASAYRDRADNVHDQMVNMLHNLKKGMEAPTGSRLEAFLDEWTDLLEGTAPTPPAVATVARECSFPHSCRPGWCMVNGKAICANIAPTVAPEGPSEEARKVAENILYLILTPQEPKPLDYSTDMLARALDNLAGRGRA